VLDAHHHLIFPDRIRYPDLEAAMPEINRSFAPADLEPQLRAAGVDGTILVQAANDSTETALLLQVAARTPWVRGVVGWVPLDSPRATEAALDELAALPDSSGLVGIRYLIHREPDPAWLSAPARLDALRVLAERGLAYELLALVKGHLENALTIVEQVPGLTLVLDHLAGPYVRGKRWQPWADTVAELARRSRCVVKYSGLDPIDGSVEEYRPYVEHLFAHFGPARMLWASNWPASRLGGAYELLVADSLRLLPELTPAERAGVFGDNARRTYGLETAPP